ncbi:uncharacterized protein LOC136041099 isoform X2 [Artemia franciscana]|uniref:Uncharacterized protein n=1 Tax=Artemia franciscana TaxID=6661 RepID=A0AA88L9U9_ARTSF|nr:hypothetical protein QYM36_009431 [Artemia franciscana]
MNVLEFGLAAYFLLIYSCVSIPLGEQNFSSIYPFFDWLKTTPPNPYKSTTISSVQFIPSDVYLTKRGKKKVKRVKSKQRKIAHSSFGGAASNMLLNPVTPHASTAKPEENFTATTTSPTVENIKSFNGSSYNTTYSTLEGYVAELIPDEVLESLTEVVLTATTTEPSFIHRMETRFPTEPRNGYGGGYNNQSYGTHYLSDLAVLFLALIPIALVLGAAAAFALNGSRTTATGTGQTQTNAGTGTANNVNNNPNNNNNNNNQRFPVIIINLIPETTEATTTEAEFF